MTNARRGFTLIELMVVIFILAILIAVLLPVLSNARRRTMESKLRSRDADALSSITRPQDAAPAHEPPVARPLAQVKSFLADVTLTPRLSVGTAEPESIYEAKFAAKMLATRGKEPGENEIELPLPPQIISLADLTVKVNGQESDAVTLRGNKLVWQGNLTGDAPAPVEVTYSAMGKGLYELQTPPAKILDKFQIKLTANGSDVRMLELSMQPTDLKRESGHTTYTWDYSKLMFGHPIALDVLGIAPIDRLGELGWLGPASVIAFGLVLGLISRAFQMERFDRWMLLLVLGTFTGAFPLMYFAQEFISLNWAMLAASVLVLLIIGIRAVSIMGFTLGVGGVVLPAGAIMALTLAAAVRPNLQGILLTALCLGLFIVAMVLAPRMKWTRPTLGGGPAVAIA